jgi:hypothetical protein
VVYSEKLKGRDHWEVLDVDVRIILWHDAWTPEVCRQRSTSETSIARQRPGKHLPAYAGDNNSASTAIQYIGKYAWSTREDIGCWTMDVLSGWSVSKGYKGQRRSSAVSRVSSASRPRSELLSAVQWLWKSGCE